jgi:hypothetical protein
MQAPYFLSSGATTLTISFGETNAIISFSILSSIPENILNLPIQEFFHKDHSSHQY